MNENENITVCFDLDGCLIHQVGEKEDTPRYGIIQLFHILEASGCKLCVWSGGGKDYAARWVEKLGLKALVVEKGSFQPDIVFDDEDVKLGKVNIKV